MRFTSMIDMAKTPDDVKKDMAEYPMTVPGGGKPSGPLYPYELCISFNDEILEKLGMDGKLPEVGDMIHLAAMAKVTSVSQNEREDTAGEKKQCNRIELQITHLATQNEDIEVAEKETTARRKRFYEKMDGEADAA